MFCRFCGKENDNQSRFCVACGRSMTDNSIPQTAPPAAPENIIPQVNIPVQPQTYMNQPPVPVETPVYTEPQNVAPVQQQPIYTEQPASFGTPVNAEPQPVATQDTGWGPTSQTEPESYASQPVNQMPINNQPINQGQVDNNIPFGTPASQVPNTGSPGQDPGLFSSPDVRQLRGKPKKKKWLIPVIAAAAAVLVLGTVFVIASWKDITKAMSPEKYLEASIADLNNPEDLMLLPSLKGGSKKAFSLKGDAFFPEGDIGADFEWLYDQTGKQLQLTMGMDAAGQKIFEDLSVYLTPEVLALYMDDLSDDFSYLKVDLDTLPVDWNKSTYAKDAGIEIPDVDISSYIELLFTDYASMDSKDLFAGSDEELKKIYEEFSNAIVFKDEGDEEIKVGGKPINTSVMSQTVPGKAMKAFVVDYMDISMSNLMDIYKDLGMSDMYTEAMSGVFDAVSFEDTTITYFIDSSDKIRRIELSVAAIVDSESVEIDYTLDLMGVEHPLDSFELTMAMNGVEIVIEREGIRGSNKNTDYLAIYEKESNETALTYNMTWDKVANFLEIKINTEDVEIILDGTVIATDEKVSFEDMLLTYEDYFWEETTILAEFSLEMSRVNAKDVFPDVNDKNSKNFLDLNITELQELMSKFGNGMFDSGMVEDFQF